MEHFYANLQSDLYLLICDTENILDKMYYSQLQKGTSTASKLVQHPRAFLDNRDKIKKQSRSHFNTEFPKPAKQRQKTEQLIKASAAGSAECSDVDFRSARTRKRRCLVATSCKSKVNPPLCVCVFFYFRCYKDSMS